MPDLGGTIAAEATPPGRGAVRVVRITGPLAGPFLRKHFHPVGPPPSESARRLCLGELVREDGRVVDRALAVLFVGPDSLTGEDVAEIQVHGSPGVVRACLDLCFRFGIRQARPGEFLWRAVILDKMSLSEAEAVDALVSADTEALALRAASALGGRLSGRLSELSARVLDLRAAWEARLDFPEDVGEMASTKEEGELEGLAAGLAALAREGEIGARMARGWSVALVGPPNSGKSSLFNRLLCRERALVTPHPGTTRDVLEETLEIGGLPLIVRDTAGVRVAEGEAEGLGVERGLEAAAASDGTLLVFDGSRGWGEDAAAVLARLERPPLWTVANKCDLPPGAPVCPGALSVSALTGEGMEALVEALRAWMGEVSPAGGEIPPAGERQARAVARAAAALKEALLGHRAGQGLEITLSALSAADRSLREAISGEASDEELYERIFSRFCIGK
ncbi:MAG: tRNA modification GTPase [Acidobacteriota bacterium]